MSAAPIARSEPVDGTRGVIVNTASIAAYEDKVGQLRYAAAKGGVMSMTPVAARDLAPLGIRLEAYWGPQVPHPKRMGRSSEYATMVASIIEDDCLNGEMIRLDGALPFPPKQSAFGDRPRSRPSWAGCSR